MSHVTPPMRNPVTETNTSTTQQIARAVNTSSPNTISIATNTSSVEQSNVPDGSTGTGTIGATVEANHSTTLQFAIAVNYDSPDATAIATNISFTEQVNELTPGGTSHGGAVTQVNDSSVVQIDIALNIDSPNAIAIAGNSNVTEQLNGLTIGGTSQNGHVVHMNTNTTIQLGVALDIDSPGAVALAGNSSTTIQENSLGALLVDLGQLGFINDTHGFGADQHKSNHGGFVSSSSAMLLTNSNSNPFIQLDLLGTLLQEAGLSLADLGLPSLTSGTHVAGPCFGADGHGPNHGGFAMPHLPSHFGDCAPMHLI